VAQAGREACITIKRRDPRAPSGSVRARYHDINDAMLDANARETDWKISRATSIVIRG
jgi:hypothetical protein